MLAGGIPWRRGYLFQGIPGSGKSSMVHVMASELSMHIYSISLSNNKIDDATFQELAQKVPERSILLLEDVDVAFANREQKLTGITLSSLLNAIDGVGATDGRILVLSTNRKEVLDEALIRPGRVDYELAFTHATSSQAYELFLRWYKPASRRTDSGSLAHSQIEKLRSDEQDLEKEARSFAQAIPNERVSVAALQGHLLKYPHEPLKAVQTLSRWLSEQAGKDDAV
ncbi:P-loop containing nucleoside triphosphate hydrolase protein [Ceraceosorus guamensis]|uniref:P-loop containing nucleoside triphosphate hydrolase protein n=1 Tax=Ceraceosorus guamensis TaxID=1522189 RepID=A0A316VUL2_9BASI|nr:P-loop containing nucleoside triphosphate hydrolase protein [Ceraceosorus guamensis]PWN41306.1 P-loop containing nucleoside triphosphate hydrolase protein [Ceraceosorus guamensis]